MRLAIWSTTAARENSTHMEMFRRQLAEVELAERIGIDQIWFFEHHLQPTAPVPSPNLLIAAAARTTRHIRFASMVNILPFRHPLLVPEEAAMLDNLTGGRLDMGLGRGLRPPVSDTDAHARAEAQPYLLQYWQLWNRYTQFTRGGRLPDSYDFWRRQAPMLHAMSFEEIVANDMVMLGSAETVANAILRLSSQLDLMGLAMIFKLGAMPYDIVDRSMTIFGEQVVPRIRHVLDRDAAANRAAAAPALHLV